MADRITAQVRHDGDLKVGQLLFFGDSTTPVLVGNRNRNWGTDGHCRHDCWTSPITAITTLSLRAGAWEFPAVPKDRGVEYDEEHQRSLGVLLWHGLVTVGDLVETSDGQRILIGDINLNGGVCDKSIEGQTEALFDLNVVRIKRLWRHPPPPSKES